MMRPYIATAGAAEFYASLDPAEREAIGKSEAMLNGAEEGDVESTFVKGEAVRMARDAVSEGKFAHWCRVRWRKHRTYAYDHLRVVEHLTHLRARIVRARIQPSVVLALASCPDRAEEIVLRFEDGERPSVSSIRAMLAAADQSTEQKDLEELGGIRGLERLHAAKRRRLQALVERLEGIVAAVEATLPPPAGGRVLKGALAYAIVREARHARLELLDLCAALEVSPDDPATLRPAPFIEGSRWREVSDVLYEIGGAESWPPATRLEAWLREKVLPLLAWAARGESGKRATLRWPTGLRPDQARVSQAEELHDLEPAGLPQGDAVSEDAGAASGAPSTMRFDEERVRSVTSFLSHIRPKLVPGHPATAAIDEIFRKTATELSDLMICQKRLHGTSGPAEDERRHLAELLFQATRTGGIVDAKRACQRL